MKKIILALMLLSGLSSYAQIQKVDSISDDRIDRIETKLTSYYAQNRTSQALIFLGSFLSIATPILMYGDNTQTAVVCQILGGGLCLTGGIIYLDSFKHLNFHRRAQQPKIKIDNYYW